MQGSLTALSFLPPPGVRIGQPFQGSLHVRSPAPARPHSRPAPVEVGADRVHRRTFYGGGPTEAMVGCPDGDAPILWQVAVCSECPTDLIVARFATVKHQRTVALAKDMSAAADEIVKLRYHARVKSATPPNCAPRSSRSGKSLVCLKTRRFTTSLAGDPRCCDRAPRGLVEQERPQGIAHRHLRQVARALRQSRDRSSHSPIGEPI